MNEKKPYGPPATLPHRTESGTGQPAAWLRLLHTMVETPVAIRRSFRASEYPSTWETTDHVLPNKPWGNE